MHNVALRHGPRPVNEREERKRRDIDMHRQLRSSLRLHTIGKPLHTINNTVKEQGLSGRCEGGVGALLMAGLGWDRPIKA